MGPALLASLALMSAAAPLGTDMYLPGLVDIARELNTTASSVQLTLTTFMAGMAVGQLLAGPVSDALGRKVNLIASSIAFLLTSIGCAVAPNIGVLIAMRLLQGLAGGAGVVVARSVIPDLMRGRAAAKAFSLMMSINGLAPIVGPIIGGFLIPIAGWRGVFWVLAGLNVAMILVSLFVVPESLPPARRTQGALKGLLPGIARVLRVPRFILLQFAFAVGFCVMFSYISASPFVLQEQLGLSAQAYSLAFGLNAALMVTVSTLNVKFVDKLPPHRLLVIGLATATAAGVGIVLDGAFGPTLWATLPLLMIGIGSMGLVMGNATTTAIDQVGRHGAGAGAASGLLGFTQFVLAAVISPLMGLGPNAALTMGIGMTACGIIALTCALIAGRGLVVPDDHVTLD